MVGLPFLKKREPEVMTGKGFSPIDRIGEMASRGFSEPEMIDVLRREGFSPDEIDKALTQGLKAGVSAPSSQPVEPTLPTLEQIMPQPQEMMQAPETSLPAEYYQQYPSEEYIDAIVQARVSEVNEKVTEFTVKYNEMEKKVDAINEQLSEFLKIRSNEQQQILSKIDIFNDSLGDSNSRLGSLEKAFKETLPALIEGVRALSDVVQRMKREA
jgi:DNA-binding transcriptional MerR regulator